jgi:hypothetical protein
MKPWRSLSTRVTQRKEPNVTDSEDRLRILHDIGRTLTQRFGDDLFIRIGPHFEPWSGAVVMEVFAPNTATAPAEVTLDGDNCYLIFGDAIDRILFEQHPLDEHCASWVVERIVAAGERGLEMWRDSRRHLFGGQHRARVVGEEFTDLTEKHRARLSLSLTTEPWTTPASTDLEDPVPRVERGGTVFLVDHALPISLQRIARRARLEFGSGISVVTRMDELGQPRMLEILPADHKATRMRIKELGPASIEVSTGVYQYLEYEFQEIPAAEAEEWILDVGRFGLLETTLTRGRIFWFVNGPATPAAIAAAESNRRVSAEPLWQPWLR